MNKRQRVLFVCVGNACRSQMAEAFARAYGSDVLVPASAGFIPAAKVPPRHPTRHGRKEH
jgi:arsenate reductase